MRCWPRLIGGQRTSACRLSGTSVCRAAAWWEESRQDCGEILSSSSGCAGAATTGRPRRGLDATTIVRARDTISRSQRTRAGSPPKKAELRRQWRQLQWVAVMLAVLLAVVATMAYVARRENYRARVENLRAETNLRLARAAVDESLVVAERDPSLLGVDVPAIVGFGASCSRRLRGSISSSSSRRRPTPISVPRWHSPISVWGTSTVRSARAGWELRTIAARSNSSKRWPASIRDVLDYRQSLANAYNWLGESLRRGGDRYTEAKAAYDSALRLHEELRRARPAEAVHQQDLREDVLRPRVLYANHEGRDGASAQLAENDFREGIRLLESLASGAATRQRRRSWVAPITISPASSPPATVASRTRESFTRGRSASTKV